VVLPLGILKGDMIEDAAEKAGGKGQEGTGNATGD
jgi:uncharacterized protein YjbJ (UPF0337 family)